jgi:hypothetical protein
MINWREKLVATGVHFAVTMLLAAIAAALIFLVWFPDPFQTIVGGTGLFLLVVGCDLALGPLLSLVIYNSRKSRRELFTDYAVVGAIQIAALVYGVVIVAGTRPVYVAFNTDRFEVVTARDIDDAERAAARLPEYASLPWTGPTLVAIHVPEADRNDATFQALEGNEEHQRPKFYVPLASKLDAIRQRAKPLPELESRKPESKAMIEEVTRRGAGSANTLAWVPLSYRGVFWTALVDTTTGRPAAYIPVDPY